MFQGKQIDPAVRRCRHLAHPQIKAFENLQQAVEGWRLDGNRITGLGDGAQGQVKRLGGAVGDHDLLGAQVGFAGQGAASEDVAQGEVAAGGRGGAQQLLILTQRLDHVVLQGLQRVELRRAIRVGEIDLDRRSLARLEYRRHLLVNADVCIGSQRRRWQGVGQGFRLANIVARARTRLQHPLALQLPAHLHRSRQADRVLLHHQADRRKAFAGFQGAAADRVEVVIG